MKHFFDCTTVVAAVLLAAQNLYAQQTDSCLAEINGAKKGEPGNIQDNMFHSLAIDPKNENIVYAGTETSGMFKTTDGGKTWTRLRKGLKCTINQTGYAQIFDIAYDYEINERLVERERSLRRPGS